MSHGARKRSPVRVLLQGRMDSGWVDLTAFEAQALITPVIQRSCVQDQAAKRGLQKLQAAIRVMIMRTP